MLIKVLEEWVKCYKSKSLIAQGDDEEDHEEPVTPVAERQPFDLESFRSLLNQIVDLYLHKTSQPDCSIAVLSILNNLDAIQWRKTFTP